MVVLHGLAFLPASAQAVRFLQTGHFELSPDAVQGEEIWVHAQTIEMDGTLKDDLFAAGQVVRLNGTFEEAVWCVAEQLSAGGVFHRNTRLAFQNAQVSGQFSGSLTALGTAFEMGPETAIEKGLLFAGGNITTAGKIGGDVRIAANKATLGGIFQGHVKVAAADLVVLPGTVIEGNLTYTMPRELVLPPSVRLSGELIRQFDPVPDRQWLKANLAIHFFFAAAALLTGLVFMVVFPACTARSQQLMQNAAPRCLLAGFIALFLIPFLAVFLLLTLVGIPLAGMLMLFYFILIYIGKILSALWIGSLFVNRGGPPKRKPAVRLLLGLLLLYLLTALTAISPIINFLAALFGAGALLLALLKPTLIVIHTDGEGTVQRT